jgi:membrane protein implicated in regulation of membrane protease activity
MTKTVCLKNLIVLQLGLFLLNLSLNIHVFFISFKILTVVKLIYIRKIRISEIREKNEVKKTESAKKKKTKLYEKEVNQKIYTKLKSLLYV